MKVRSGSSKKAKPAKKEEKISEMSPTDNVNINIRKIKNGYIIRKSGNGKDGNYMEEEVYSETKPEIGV